MSTVNGILLLKINNDSEIAVAKRRWPVLQSIALGTGDEMWSMNPPMPGLPKIFVAIRGTEQLYTCPMSQAESKTTK